MSTVAVVALALVAVLVVAALTVWCVTRVRRLDRLHRRVDAARAGLGGALARRVEVARRVAAALDERSAERLRAAAATADATRAPAPDGRDPAGARQAREAAENALTSRLARVDPNRLSRPLSAELADAQQLVILARRVHNDAVRDTLGLRSRRLVRWLHLVGTAPVPVYFEIVDPEPGGGAAPGADVDSSSRPSVR
ncbi:NUDIX hydrolase [Pseudonocardia sp. KRD291]|uniref:NUDIX hydrolase n=1 Tax=Pseudonocardia sp. KRD291 TaxID=2792007 RepID=UPI001C4A624E|nr:NUDIX hydrolase [Pseudonocardia sp. KRD291]MBW0103782.1 NUDIX hydrolase [Pseudonocardia sp. KRD291]